MGNNEIIHILHIIIGVQSNNFRVLSNRIILNDISKFDAK